MSGYSFKEIRVHDEAPPSLHGLWQADCGDDHARGATPGEAASRLVEYIIAKREAEKPEWISVSRLGSHYEERLDARSQKPHFQHRLLPRFNNSFEAEWQEGPAPQ